MKKKIILSATVLTILGASAFAATQPVSAQTSRDEAHLNLAQKIAQRFGVKQEDVLSVMNEHRTEMQSQRQAKAEEQLSQLVKDGKLTEAQKQLLIAKHKELAANHQALHDAMKDKTPAERQAAMEKHRAELEAWAKQNGIDPQYIFGRFMKGQGMGRGGMMKEQR